MLFNLLMFYICSIVHVHAYLVCDARTKYNTWTNQGKTKVVVFVNYRFGFFLSLFEQELKLNYNLGPSFFPLLKLKFKLLLP
jgi:hypothetical protein